MEGNWIYKSNQKAASFLEAAGCVLIEDKKPLYEENYNFEVVHTASIPILRVSGGISTGLSYTQFHNLLKNNNLLISQQG